MSERFRQLDDKVLGGAVPDDRPLSQRLVRPRPAVWSGRGKLMYGLALVAMLAALRWRPNPAMGVIAVVVLWGVAMLVSATDERTRARRFYKEDDE